MKLETDGIQYEILGDAIRAVLDVPGLFLEIGTRRGGSMQIIVDETVATCQDRVIVSVDPYGNIPYNDGSGLTHYDYTNDMRKAAMADLYAYTRSLPVHLITFTMTDRQFFRYFKDGVPVHAAGESYLENYYAFAFLDGPHDVPSIFTELRFLAPRMTAGARVVIDNIDLFPVDKMLEHAQALRFKEISRNQQKIQLCKR